MNTYFLLVLALVLPNIYLTREVAPQDKSILLKDIPLFLKDSKSNPNARIIGGEEVAPHSYPFQAALYINSGGYFYFCGGSLISLSWVLTSARCVALFIGTEVSYILVGLGLHDLSATEPTSLLLNSTRFIYHPDWNQRTLQNDIGLVKLPRDVVLNDYIKAVPLARGTQSYEQEVSTVLGWGSMGVTPDLVDSLRGVNATVLSNSACAAEDSALELLLAPSHLCTSGEGIKGTCSGDIGGPVVVNGVQVGITSFGFSNCSLGKPSVFTRVTYFYDWVMENVNE